MSTIFSSSSSSRKAINKHPLREYPRRNDLDKYVTCEECWDNVSRKEIKIIRNPYSSRTDFPILFVCQNCYDELMDTYYPHDNAQEAEKQFSELLRDFTERIKTSTPQEEEGKSDE